MRNCTKVLETASRRLLVILVLALVLAGVAGMPRSAEAVQDGEEQAFVTLINNFRAQNGLGALSLNTQLNNAADWMSVDMGANNYFSHTDSLGRDPFQRMADFGYNYNTWKGENLVAGAETAQAAFDLWKGSAGHKANMLNPNFTVMGIARVYVNPGECPPPSPANPDPKGYGWYWTNDFGGQGSAPPPPAPTPAPTTPPPPPPPPPPEPTPEPTQEPTPAPTPEVTPEPTPVAPNRGDIQSQLTSVWERLNVVGVEDSVLRHVSYLAERYLLARDGLLVQEAGEDSAVDVRVAGVKTGELWLAILKG